MTKDRLLEKLEPMLKQHPLPWGIGRDGYVLDANEEGVMRIDRAPNSGDAIEFLKILLVFLES
jgi:hypothetical protein